ncbi:Mycobacterium numidiamassiliense ORFan [Mycobacterium numidiamassiliense]|uniref:Mycobacterium numidiamassiliense ORFan n=1 Tax=Mycobacterium numidiamassiliense TaxID=1841861 RepID=A0A2U3PFD5_9MYCO|nr:Mycobacterium numidiamassiliense ORFan [Mycobacterium numidiamassiliense]
MRSIVVPDAFFVVAINASKHYGHSRSIIGT